MADEADVHRAEPGDQGPILGELRRFVDTQVALVAAFHRAFARGEFWFREIPQVGAMELDGRRWEYVRHGGGVGFYERVSRRAIDVHDKFDRPHMFDAWRLQLYFGSLGRTGMKMLERACGRRGISAKDALALLVPHWRDLGAVVDVSGALTLADRE
ncbi:DUF6896 domain-containing protein [Nannocystis punicea]|uniref:DUF6896 domain-containing protein n=1 Tax=Nannocystis punicea TaxID=2995304 RepID=A0ABY7HJI2_9BACT|nr:hypothetical protein [Nannocystis poenicansa]WAS99273.1 hypothetical protein O0S08_24360 [Nannocystis poenicansa]